MSDQATQLIPDYTLEQFYTSEPYEYLYQQKDNAFMLQTMLQKMSKKAKSVGYVGFMATWRAFIQAQRSDVNIGGQNETMFPDQPVQLNCGTYDCSQGKVKRTNEFGIEVEVISHPLLPVRRVTNIETFEEKLEIAYCRGRENWRHITVSREVLASAQRIIGLAKTGIAVNSENAKEVVRYMGTLESENFDDLERQDSVGHMGWLPDGSFAPYAEKIAYDGDSPEFIRMYEDFKPTGDYETWLNLAKEVRAGDSVPARIALAASFAAPLVQVMGGLPFFVHLWGAAGCGKTVGLMLAASVWGNPTVGQYVKTFSGTKVSQELYAAFCCNLPILFDELQVISDRKSFDDVIYMLCEGVSKGRGAKEGGLQTQRRWSSCIITTGEMPITQVNSGGGAVARTIEVNYNGEPLFRDARRVANTLKDNYGFAGPEFIRTIQQEDVQNAAKVLQKKFYDQLIKEDIHDKQVLSASILLAADSLATSAIFKDKRALTMDDIKGYLVTQSEVDVNLRCYNWLIGYLETNLRRFDPEDINNGEIWGFFKDGYVFINRSAFDSILKNNGYSSGAFLEWAKRHDMIKCMNYGKGNKNNRLTWQVKKDGRIIHHVALKLPEENSLTEVEDDADMPF